MLVLSLSRTCSTLSLDQRDSFLDHPLEILMALEVTFTVQALENSHRAVDRRVQFLQGGSTGDAEDVAPRKTALRWARTMSFGRPNLSFNTSRALQYRLGLYMNPAIVFFASPVTEA